VTLARSAGFGITPPSAKAGCDAAYEEACFSETTELIQLDRTPTRANSIATAGAHAKPVYLIAIKNMTLIHKSG
jgi:hypothetical protein